MRSENFLKKLSAAELNQLAETYTQYLARHEALAGQLRAVATQCPTIAEPEIQRGDQMIDELLQVNAQMNQLVDKLGVDSPFSPSSSNDASDTERGLVPRGD
jgi:predicted outer membrane protein